MWGARVSGRVLSQTRTEWNILQRECIGETPPTLCLSCHQGQEEIGTFPCYYGATVFRALDHIGQLHRGRDISYSKTGKVNIWFLYSLNMEKIQHLVNIIADTQSLAIGMWPRKRYLVGFQRAEELAEDRPCSGAKRRGVKTNACWLTSSQMCLQHSECFEMVDRRRQKSKEGKRNWLTQMQYWRWSEWLSSWRVGIKNEMKSWCLTCASRCSAVGGSASSHSTFVFLKLLKVFHSHTCFIYLFLKLSVLHHTHVCTQAFNRNRCSFINQFFTCFAI